MARRTSKNMVNNVCCVICLVVLVLVIVLLVRQSASCEKFFNQGQAQPRGRAAFRRLMSESGGRPQGGPGSGHTNTNRGYRRGLDAAPNGRLLTEIRSNKLLTGP